MFRHIPMPLLLAAAAAVLTLDLAITAPVAHSEGELTDAIPEEIPMEAFMTGPVVEEADIDGLAVVLEPKGKGFVLEITNPGDEPARLAALAETYETRGSMMSRMMPMPRRMASQKLDTVVPPGETVQIALDHEVKGDKLQPGSFRTTEVALSTADGSLSRLLHEDSNEMAL